MSIKATIHDCTVIDLPQVSDINGDMTTINDRIEIPFSIKRVFYLYDISSAESRGSHAHKTCQQFLIAVKGSFEVVLDDGKEKATVLLDDPQKGLFIEAGIWDSQINFSSGAICLVIASKIYLESDYIRNYSDFLNYKSII
jgi:dTDP-4-dehydrorhamnose 3,5-epimerase-like enzyme